jgi:hypothetical protein
MASRRLLAKEPAPNGSADLGCFTDRAIDGARIPDPPLQDRPLNRSVIADPQPQLPHRIL